MLKYWPFKKDYLLLTGILLLAVVCYRLAFRKTIELWQQHRKLSSELSESISPGYQPGFLERQENNLDHLLELYQADTTTFRNEAVTTIATLAEKNQVKLTDVPSANAVIQTDHALIQRLGFNGNFFALTTFLHALESHPAVGMVRSVTWRQPKRDPNNKDSGYLLLDIYLEIRKK